MNWTESETNSVTLEDWDSGTIRELLCFMYVGEAHVETVERGQRLLQASMHFQVPELEGQLIEVLGLSLSEDTCVEMLRFAAVEDNIPSLVRRSLQAVRELQEVQDREEAEALLGLADELRDMDGGRLQQELRSIAFEKAEVAVRAGNCMDLMVCALVFLSVFSSAFHVRTHKHRPLVVRMLVERKAPDRWSSGAWRWHKRRPWRLLGS